MAGTRRRHERSIRIQKDVGPGADLRGDSQGARRDDAVPLQVARRAEAGEPHTRPKEDVSLQTSSNKFQAIELRQGPFVTAVHYSNQSDSDSSRILVMMLRHVRSAQRMMLRWRTVNSPSMIARFTMSSILSSADDPAVTS